MGIDFLLQPIFLHIFSASTHLLLLIVLFSSWVLTKMRSNLIEDQKQSVMRRSMLLHSKQALFCCLGLSILDLVFCFVNLFYWYTNGWSDEKIVALLDSVLRTLAWLAVSVYLHTQFSQPKYPLLLRIWWGFFFSFSCYALAIDYFYYKNHHPLLNRFSIADFVSAVMGLFLCYMGFAHKSEGGDTLTLAQEPLLSDEESNKSNESESETLSPYSTANIFSILTFSWMSPLISTGYKKTLDLEDVPQLDTADSVNGSYPVLKNKLESDTQRSGDVTTVGLVKALILITWKEILLTAILAVVYTSATYVGPYLIDTFVQYLNGRRGFRNEGFVLVSAFSGAKLVECVAERIWYFKLQQIGIRARASLDAMIYRKGLTLSCQSKQVRTSGEIINIMTVDAERVGDFIWYLHQPWLVLFQVALALLILYKNLGLASVAALVATVIVMLANLPLGKWQEKYQDELMKSKDKRMKATSEILRNMRILKLQGWEMKFLSKIVELRKIELGWLCKFVYTNAMTIFVFWGAPTFVSVVTFGTCMLMGIPLESGKVLSSLATFRILQIPIYVLPDVVSEMAQTKVSLDRISRFLCLEDLKSDVVEKLPRGSSNMAIEIVSGNFSWDASSSNLTLKDIDVRVFQGMRVAVSGTVGSGKSSLLSCILGEMPKVSGSIKLSGTTAYVAQSPWIQSGKIEENILFGKKMDREKYERVLESCALKKDLEILSFGDQTIIGERGINLSGGQKQRIQFARALYQDADIYLFDDPFSAVDAHTGSHLFRECIMRLLASKTVIYVTHQVEFLPAADLVLVMKDGSITQAGKYNDILNAGGDFMELVGAHEKALSELDSVEARTFSNAETISEKDNGIREHNNKDDHNGKSDDLVEPKSQLVQEEEREKGRVGFSVYWKYITTAYRGSLVPFILLAQILFQLFQIGSNYWMAWATPVSDNTVPPVEGSTMIIVYVALAIGSSFCVFWRALLLAAAGLKTATVLFNKLHFCIFRAPMSFFDSTPSGRILNRASTDQSALDLTIPYQVSGFVFSLIQLLGIIAVMSQVAWQVFLVFIPVITVCIWLQKYYIPSARELARLSGVCKAPVIQHFAETISGSTTIRSFNQEARFEDTSIKLIDSYSRPKFYSAVAMEWLSFRLDMLSSATFAFSLVFLILVPEGTISPSLAGLAVTYGLNLNMLQSRVIWNLCNMENKIISVERILQYTSISSEAPLVIQSSKIGSHWPSNGEIDIRNLQVRYAPHMPLVLRGLTCTFQGGKKTGIVGRTGSGKSTLIQALFRLIEPAAGEIFIDGVNISLIGLHDLRCRLSIIPQDPTMFEGTIRSNLDPLEEHTDEEIWESLDKCQLGDEVRKKESMLDSPVIENGDNWSMGQRQLVCLGRVLLKKSKVLVLDEATASVDTATDNLIQQTLREHFSDTTVVTIAHRITSVIDSDMVLFLDNGLIKEYDTPLNLLENKSSSFAKLVAEYSMRANSSFESIANI